MDRRFKKRIERYFAEQVARYSSHIRARELEGWFDFWHVHPDFRSKANRARAVAAEATLQLLDVAEAYFASRSAPIQIFATLCEDTGSNALYLHAPNPNKTEFPHTFPGVSWGATLPDELSSVSVSSEYEVGRADYDSDVVYLVRRRA